MDLASEAGLPVAAIALAILLVQGAKFLEKGASDRALHLLSDLITKGDARNIGKAGASVVPFVFDRVFGLKPFSIRFISRSILATTLFWLLLLLLKNVDLKFAAEQLTVYELLILPAWYVMDWTSLLKARLLMRAISQRSGIISSLFFVVVDLLCSYTLPLLLWILLLIPATTIFGESPTRSSQEYFWEILETYGSLKPITDYFIADPIIFPLGTIFIPSTMLTSMWTLLLFISCLVAQLLVPIDYLRRFTAFWFKDVEHHPLTAIAKVAATLIVVGATAVKAVHWGY